jgi:hypothetical protein
MKKILAATLIGLSLFSFTVQAGEFLDLKDKIAAVRSAMIEMALHKDKRGADKQKEGKDKVDAVKAALAKLKAPAGKEAQFKEMKETLTAFLNTRDNELLPLVLGDKAEEAKKILATVQKARFTKMSDLLAELDK